MSQSTQGIRIAELEAKMQAQSEQMAALLAQNADLKTQNTTLSERRTAPKKRGKVYHGSCCKLGFTNKEYTKKLEDGTTRTTKPQRLTTITPSKVDDWAAKGLTNQVVFLLGYALNHAEVPSTCEDPKARAMFEALRHDVLARCKDIHETVHVWACDPDGQEYVVNT